MVKISKRINQRKMDSTSTERKQLQQDIIKGAMERYLKTKIKGGMQGNHLGKVLCSKMEC
jgi:hypothetical protein